MKIIRGKIPHAKKFAVYGPEGIGKSTFASKFPEPVFIDTEGSTKEMDVSRFEKPTSWSMILEQIKYIHDHPETCKTLVIDTVDWAEQMCIEHICAKHQKDGLESFGYGSGYIYVREEFGRFLNRLEEVVECGVNVVLIAHAQLRKFEQPDEMGAYDRWELKLGKKTASQISPLIKEWSDALLFANYKTYSIAVDDKGKKHKAQGGRRVMYTSHHPCWDAKNRYGLPEEIPFEYGQIAHIIGAGAAVREAPVPDRSTQMPKEDPPVTVQNPVQQEPPLNMREPSRNLSVPDYIVLQQSKEENVSKELLDLMIANQVTEWDVQAAVGAKGYFPSDMPIEQYPEDFVQGCLIAAWSKVYELIKKTQKELDEEIPFK